METEKKCLAENDGSDIPSGNGETEMSQDVDVEKLKAELEKAKNDVLYVRADYDNFRKRMLREQEQAIKFANERLILELSAIVDLLDRALGHSDTLKGRTDDKEVANFLMGIELTQKEFVQLLNRFGVEFFGAIGETFNPARHEAVSQREQSGDGSSESKVLEVVQKGTLLNGRLLKPAQVVVSKPASQS